jgi:hypothetical protein
MKTQVRAGRGCSVCNVCNVCIAILARCLRVLRPTNRLPGLATRAASIALVSLVTLLAVSQSADAARPARPALDLTGYMDWTGAVTVLYEGQFIDPYFALQALLQAHANGLDIEEPAQRFGRWLLVRQKLDATFDRFCRTGPVWLGCKTADADDALLAMWLQLIDLLPPAVRQAPEWQASRQRTATALQQLHEPARGIYLVSPVFQQGLFMDNIEVWSHLVTGDALRDAAPAISPALAPAAATHSSDAAKLAVAINKVFWDPATRRYLVSTQPEQKALHAAFYPDEVAQIYALLFDFPLPPGVDRAAVYRQWMRQHRADWLTRIKTDFAWGVLALLALHQGDRASARCWLREALPYRHSRHWTVTDEVTRQVLASRHVVSAQESDACN